MQDLNSYMYIILHIDQNEFNIKILTQLINLSGVNSIFK